MEGNSYNKALNTMRRAIQEDNDGHYETAFQLYIDGLQLFNFYLKHEAQVDSVKAPIIEKCKEYLSRAEKLKEYIEQKKNAEAEATSSGSTNLRMGRKENASKNTAIAIESPNIKWDDVAGLETAKQALKEAVIMPLKFPNVFVGKRKPWSGILLFGPPGTGKSYLAKAVATEADNCAFISLSSSDIVSKWVGESEKLVRGVFELARENKPAIIFIDEIDSLCSARSENENESARRIKTEFLVQMDGFGQGGNNEKILVLGATNMPHVLDSGMRRRFEKRIYIPLPDEDARVVLFQKAVGNTPNQLTYHDYVKYAKMTEGYSGADISIVVRDALMEPLRLVETATHFKKTSGPVHDKPNVYANDFYTPCLPSDKDGVEMNWKNIPENRLMVAPVSDRHILKAISKTRPTVSQEDIVKLEQFNREFGVD
ncbi:Vacuolar protein sorting-associated protein 4B [Thelohanellus kitauei]|uniref:Vacuolar protein sorting-associated protein 4B n=1 Tax=Thelohanellus kitauei TaxID=669202 RepID=A0A0C2M1P4_THEKT|nr:Vacuolar protein sorting-associated protein 4B [Thelohanellus kitauei]